MVSGCHGRPGPTVPAVVVVLGSDIEVVSLLAMEAGIAPSCRDPPILPWKSVRGSELNHSGPDEYLYASGRLVRIDERRKVFPVSLQSPVLTLMDAATPAVLLAW